MTDKGHSLRDRLRSVEVEWLTISYRTVTLIGVGVLVLALVILYMLYPDTFARAFDRLAAGLSGAGANSTTQQPNASQARFVNIDGTVRVKRADSTQWITADYKIALEKGDLVQTGGDGVARITFGDGTTYVIKPETLIVVEENSTSETKATRVAVNVTSGAVDLSTPRWEAPSQSTVRIENAVATLEENTRAAVRNDPRSNYREITVSAGGAQLQRGSETISLGQHERASFTTPDSAIAREKVIAPPTPEHPANLGQIVALEPKRQAIRFGWSPVNGAAGYRLKVSSSSLFMNIVVDKRVNASSYTATGLDAGTYYWVVTAFDQKGRESQEGDTAKFDLIRQPSRGDQMLLVIDNYILHGRVVEVVGRTEPGATIIINNEPVVNIGADGHFKHFTSPLPEAGSNQITITAQNRRGDVVTRKKAIYMQ